MSEDKRAGSIDPSNVYGLSGMVDYSDGSVVSRIICRSSAGNVTLFSFDEGQSLSEHTTPYDALVQIVDGKARLTIGGKSVDVEEGEIVIMPAGVPHAVIAKQRFKMLLTMLKGE
jgi:quercetin dioxygenase-like cupin family protein